MGGEGDRPSRTAAVRVQRLVHTAAPPPECSDEEAFPPLPAASAELKEALSDPDAHLLLQQPVHQEFDYTGTMRRIQASARLREAIAGAVPDLAGTCAATTLQNAIQEAKEADVPEE